MAGNPDENLRRKGRALTIATRIAATGGGAYLVRLFGPAGGAAAAQGLGELGVVPGSPPGRAEVAQAGALRSPSL